MARPGRTSIILGGICHILTIFARGAIFNCTIPIHIYGSDIQGGTILVMASEGCIPINGGHYVIEMVMRISIATRHRQGFDPMRLF